MSNIEKQIKRFEQAVKKGRVRIPITSIVIIGYSFIMTIILFILVLFIFLIGSVFILPALALDLLFTFIRRLIWER